jgi:hypothetical protein
LSDGRELIEPIPCDRCGALAYFVLHMPEPDKYAVVQGFSEIPFMQDVKHWGVLTIGTGLGNARFTNRSAKEE